MAAPTKAPRDLTRLLRPKSVAVIGGGDWCQAVVEQLVKAGFSGDIWPVHPRATSICGCAAFDGVPNLPGSPDAAFVGINRDATVGAIQRLARIGAGGAVCFASGFAEVSDGEDRNTALLAAAGDMPILGPNCYGMINAFDGALLWPDQHGCVPVDRGVAILTQSSNIAINLTMQQRGLPIGYMITTGNQAQTSQAVIAKALLDDPRVTAIGLHIEGFGNLEEWQDLARAARAKAIPLVALKVGISEQAKAATVSHTASLAGQDVGAQALLDRLGIARVSSLTSLLETLKILHLGGPLPSNTLASISCSGGEASLMADMASAHGLRFPALTPEQSNKLALALGPKVALSNPLDYHTYIWRDVAAMTAAFSAIVIPDIALTCLIVDFPRSDRCDPSDWECAIEAAMAVKAKTGARVAMIATLPELMPEDVAARLMAGGVIPLNGLADSLPAISAAIKRDTPDLECDLPVLGTLGTLETTEEHAAKAELSDFGLIIPKGGIVDQKDAAATSETMKAPFAVKATGSVHKTETGGVVLGLETSDDVDHVAKQFSGKVLLEEMVTDGIAELLVGVTRDPAHGLVLTVGAGGTFAELAPDTASVLVPVSKQTIQSMLEHLKIAPILNGYRGRKPADKPAIVAAILAIQDYALANADTVSEVEINPLICTEDGAVAVDALIRKSNDRAN